MSQELVLEMNRQAVTTSLRVADGFGKQHKHVIEAIESKMQSAENSAHYKLMFVEGAYKDSRGRSQKLYYMNRDGFTFIAMGFTGTKADNFKLKYLEAFNWMEKQLMNQYKVPATFSEALRLAADLEERNSQLMLENEMQAQVLAEYKPKITYLDKILKSRKTLTVTQIAADYDLSAYKLNQILAEEKVQRKVNNQWILFRKYMSQGYTKSETINIERHGMPDVTMQTKWTQKGRLFIHEILESRGIYAVMDLEEEA